MSQTGWLTKQKYICLTILEANKSPTSLLVRLVPSLRAVNLFHASHFASGALQATFGVPWLIEATPLSLPSSSHGVFARCESTFTTLD